jgi:hypothetical protein
MNRLLVGRVLSLGLLVVLVVLALSACGGDEKKAKARPLPEDPKALRPGTYRSEEFKPSLSFHVGKGWSSSPLLETSDALQITLGQTAGLGFANVQDVYKPTRTGSAIVVDAPEDMVGWLQQHPYLQTSQPEPVTVGGVKGVEFDVGVGDLPKGYNPTCSSIIGDPNCVDIFRLSTGGLLFGAEGYPVRVIVLEDLEGETVTIGFFSPASEFEEFVPEAQKVIDTVKWRGL